MHVGPDRVAWFRAETPVHGISRLADATAEAHDNTGPRPLRPLATSLLRIDDLNRSGRKLYYQMDDPGFKAVAR